MSMIREIKKWFASKTGKKVFLGYGVTTDNTVEIKKSLLPIEEPEDDELTPVIYRIVSKSNQFRVTSSFYDAHHVEFYNVMHLDTEETFTVPVTQFNLCFAPSVKNTTLYLVGKEKSNGH